MPENETGKHFGSHFASPGSAPTQPSWNSESEVEDDQPLASVTSNFDAIGSEALGESSTPEAVSASTAQSLDTLAPGQGARVTTRDTAAEVADAARNTFQEMGTGSMRLTGANRPQVKTKRVGSGVSGRVIGIVIAVAALLLVGGMFIVRNILTRDTGGDEGSGLIEQTQVNTSEPIEYGGYTYQVEEVPDGSYQLTRLAAGSTEPLVIAELEGKPVALILGNGVFYIPENTQAGWDVIAYMMGDGSVPSKLVDADGNEISGEGTLSTASLESNALLLTTEDGQTHTIALA